MTKFFKFSPLALFVALALSMGPSSAATALPAGPVVVARSSGNALVIWQATEFLDGLRGKKAPDQEVIAGVETGVLQILAARKKLLKNASMVTVKVLYERMADTNNKEYAATSFAGYHQVLLLSVTKSALAKLDAFPRPVDPQHLPAGVSAASVSLP